MTTIKWTNTDCSTTIYSVYWNGKEWVEEIIHLEG